MAFAAEHAQQIRFIGVAFGQRAAVAHACHLCAAFLVVAGRAGNMRQRLRMPRIGYVDDRSAAEFRLPSERIERLWHLRRAAMMADIGDVAVALMMDSRLIGAASLEIIVAD